MTDGYSLSDIQAVTNGNNGFGGDGAWWLIILFLFAFMGYGNGFGGNGGGASNNYVLASDFATIQRQLSDGFNSIDNALDRQNAGICDLGYTQAQLINNATMAQMQSANAIQTQLAQCCCDNREAIAGVNYNMAMNTNALQQTVSNGFCQTNFNGQTNTRDIIDAQNAGTRAILDAIQQNKVDALNDKIATLTADNQSLRFAASQAAQNAYIANVADCAVNRLQPCPIPAYTVPNPNCCYCGN